MRTHSERRALAVQRQCYVAMLFVFVFVFVSQDAYQGILIPLRVRLPLSLASPPSLGSKS
jgi:hypothetical protein